METIDIGVPDLRLGEQLEDGKDDEAGHGLGLFVKIPEWSYPVNPRIDSVESSKGKRVHAGPICDEMFFTSVIRISNG